MPLVENTFQPYSMYCTLTVFLCCHSADLTERRIQECLKIGIEAGFSTTSVQDGKAHVKFNKCDDVTTKSQGLASPLLVRLGNFAWFHIVPHLSHCCVKVDSKTQSSNFLHGNIFKGAPLSPRR